MAETPTGPGRPASGRPREFDLDHALDQALLVFWKQGYEGSSLIDLTTAMGIGKPSMYAAFGNKQELFRRALDRYAEGPGSYVARALEQPTARQVAEVLLRGAVQTTTAPQGFGGCLTVQGALAESPEAQPARDILVPWRNEAMRRLAERLRRALDDGDLPSDADPNRLARYLATLVFGIAVQAASGLDAGELDDVVDAALLSWPG